MSYLINFDSAIAPEQVKQAVLARWDVGPQTVWAGTEAAMAGRPGPKPTVMILSGVVPDSRFDTEFHAGETFAEVCGRLSELEVATLLCRDLGVHAMIPDGGKAPDVWTMVTADGWHGRVVVDDDALDEGLFEILYAYQEVPRAPEIEVREPPYWQHGWYDDRQIPQAGHLDVPHPGRSRSG